MGAFGKGNAQFAFHGAFVQQAVRNGFGVDPPGEQRLMPADRVHIALAQRGEHILGRGKAADLPRRRQVGGDFAQEQPLALGGGLHADALARQVRQVVDVAVGAHRYNLTAVHIRTRPLVLVGAPVHAEARPKAVHGAVLQQAVLVGPVDFLKFDLVPQAGERLGCQLNVDAGILPVAVQIAVRLKRIHTDSDGGRIGGQGVILPRAGAQPRRQRKAKPPALCPGNARSHSRT